MIWVLMSPLFVAVMLAAVVPVLLGMAHDDRARRSQDGGSGHFLVASPKTSQKHVAVVAVEAEAALSDISRAGGDDENAAVPVLIS